MKIDLSNSEWKLMNRLWQTAPMTITELTAALREDTGWSKNTVITMLSRLEGKEAVRHEEGRRAKLYFPAVDRDDGHLYPEIAEKMLTAEELDEMLKQEEDAIEAETETFLDKIGGLGLLMSAMVEKNALTENDIAELSAILEKAGGKL